MEKKELTLTLGNLGVFKLIRAVTLSGGSSVVYIASRIESCAGVQDTSGKRLYERQGQIAVKILRKRFYDDPEYVQGFYHEAEMLNGLDYKGMPHCLGYGRAYSEKGEMWHFIAMELLPGRTLSSVIEEENSSERPVLDIEDKMRIMAETAVLLDYLGQKRVIHRDIKPEHIIFDDEMNVSICDFGLAATVGNIPMQEGIAIGTPHYMSPEVFRGEISVDCRADLYSLGAVCYELFIGEPPFVGTSDAVVIYKQLNEPPVIPIVRAPHRFRENPATSDVIMKALEKEPADRYERGADMAADLGFLGKRVLEYYPR